MAGMAACKQRLQRRSPDSNVSSSGHDSGGICYYSDNLEEIKFMRFVCRHWGCWRCGDITCSRRVHCPLTHCHVSLQTAPQICHGCPCLHSKGKPIAVAEGSHPWNTMLLPLWQPRAHSSTQPKKEASPGHALSGAMGKRWVRLQPRITFRPPTSVMQSRGGGGG